MRGPSEQLCGAVLLAKIMHNTGKDRICDFCVLLNSSPSCSFQNFSLGFSIICKDMATLCLIDSDGFGL